MARQVRACSIGGLLAHTSFFPKWMTIHATLANNDNMCGARTNNHAYGQINHVLLWWSPIRMNNNKRRTAWRATAKALEIIFTIYAFTCWWNWPSYLGWIKGVLAHLLTPDESPSRSCMILDAWMLPLVFCQHQASLDRRPSSWSSSFGNVILDLYSLRSQMFVAG